MRYRPRLVVMVKEPRPGKVKTRLGRDIGMVGAAWWFRNQVTRLLREVDSPRWETILAVAPDHEGLRSRIWPAHLPRVAQGSGDLGARMGKLLRSLPPGPVCIVGADVPDITQSHITCAFAALGNHQAVLGPAEDGGYWLVGLKRITPPPAILFKDVRWSTQHTLTDTLVGLRGMDVALIDRLRDVDTMADLSKAP